MCIYLEEIEKIIIVENLNIWRVLCSLFMRSLSEVLCTLLIGNEAIGDRLDSWQNGSG